MNIAKLQHTKPFMPPFAGTAEELESLVQFILWSSAGGPTEWTVADEETNAQTIARIDAWLKQAGTKPGVFDKNHHVNEQAMTKAD